MLWCYPFSRLRKVFVLPRMLYGLEVYSLNSKDVQQLEQLHRSFMKRSKCIPISTTTSAAYSLLGIRPIQQELDLMKLTLLGNVLFSNKHTHTYTRTHIHTHTHTKKKIKIKNTHLDTRLNSVGWQLNPSIVQAGLLTAIAFSIMGLRLTKGTLQHSAIC